jgi:two-component system, cell cycle sensor histidine kinase and response regulator CckA
MDWKQMIAKIKDIDLSKPEQISMLQKLPTALQQLVDENQSLRADLERFRGYVENASDTIVDMDLQGKITYTNSNWVRNLGYKPEEVINKRIFESMFHPEDAARASAYLQKAIDTKTIQTGFQYRIRHQDGEYRWHTANLSPVLDEQGKVRHVIAIAHSIHKLKIAELQILESEGLYKLLLNTMQEAVIMVDNDDVIQYINPCCCKLFGLEPEYAIGKKGYELLILKEDHHKIIEKNRERLQGTVDEYEVRGRNAAGEIIWLRISGAPITDEDGKVIGSVGIMMDITSKKMAAEAIRRSEEKYRLLFENSIAGVFQSTMDDRYLHVNKAFARMFGYQSPEEMIDSVTDIKDLYVHPEQREKLKALLVSLGSVENYEVELIKQNGEHFWVSIFARLTTNQDGQTVLEGTNLDITESKLLYEQLLASQKMEAIGKLAGGVAHDFNNLLTVILGYSEDILEELSKEDPLYELADEIVKAGIKAANLTRQLLTFSRKQAAHSQDLNCNNLLNNIQGIILRLIGKNIALNMHLAEDLKPVRVDPEQMEQVLVNLVINAREAMPEGGVLKINTENAVLESNIPGSHSELPSGEYVAVSISDSGCGIPREIQDRVFEPFFTTKEQAKGLGLATVWGIITQAGGYVHVYSEARMGSPSSKSSSP